MHKQAVIANSFCGVDALAGQYYITDPDGAHLGNVQFRNGSVTVQRCGNGRVESRTGSSLAEPTAEEAVLAFADFDRLQPTGRIRSATSRLYRPPRWKQHREPREPGNKPIAAALRKWRAPYPAQNAK